MRHLLIITTFLIIGFNLSSQNWLINIKGDTIKNIEKVIDYDGTFYRQIGKDKSYYQYDLKKLFFDGKLITSYWCTPYDLCDNDVCYSQVFNLDSTSSKDIYISAKKYFLDNYKNPKEVIQIDDKESGLIAGKAYTDVYISLGGLFNSSSKEKMYYTISIYIKDNKYKLEIKDIYFETYSALVGGRIIQPTKTSAISVVKDEDIYKSPTKVNQKNQSYRSEMISHFHGTALIVYDHIKKNRKKSDW